MELILLGNGVFTAVAKMCNKNVIIALYRYLIYQILYRFITVVFIVSI